MTYEDFVKNRNIPIIINRHSFSRPEKIIPRRFMDEQRLVEIEIYLHLEPESVFGIFGLEDYYAWKYVGSFNAEIPANLSEKLLAVNSSDPGVK